MINPGDVEILLVEDSAIQAELLRRRLVQEGYQVSVAENGAKALAIIRKAKPSLIISDIVMPIMDGYKLCHEIKRDEELKDIPVILLTDLSDPKDVIKGLDAKADNYVTKPYNDKLLLARIEAILSRAIDYQDDDQTGALELTYGGETHRITSGRREILNLLISTYENAAEQNRELIKAQNNLRALNQELDIKLSELQDSEERFRLLVQTAGNAIVLLSPNFLILEWNYEAERVFGKTRDVALGQHFFALFDSEAQIDMVDENLKKVLSGTQIRDLETSFQNQDGTSRILLWNFNCLLDSEKNPLGIIAVGQDVTEWKRAEEEKVNARTEAELNRISAHIATETIDGMMDAVVIVNPQGKIIQYNQGFQESFGWGREVLGDFLAHYVVGADIQKALEEIGEGRGDENYLKNIDCQLITRDHNEVPVLVNATLLKDPEGKSTKIITVIRDITERKHYEEALQERSAEMSVLYEISSNIVGSMNVEEIFTRLVNTILELEMFNICKLASLFIVEDGRMRLISHPTHSQEFIDLHRDMQVGDCLCGVAAQTGEIIISADCFQDARHTMRCHDTGCHGHIILPLMVMEEVKGVLSFTCASHFELDKNQEKILRTIGGQIGIALDNAALHEKTKALSLSDPLTGIANRRLLDMMLDNSLARVRRNRGLLAVVMADIDYFKNFNDTYGHLEGDKLLSTIAGLISGEIRQADMVARYGGEEFLIMLPDANREHALKTAERIRSKIAEQTGVTISLGVASYHKGIENKEDLINKADQAMYRAKQNGRNQVQVMAQDHGL